MTRQRLIRSAALGLTLAAVAAPMATAQHQDLRSPDARDAALPAPVAQDLRAPDTRDAAAGRGTFSAPDVTVVTLPQRSSQPEGSIDWSDAGIGAGSLLGLIVLALAGSWAVVHRRRSSTPRPRTATTG